jgi:indolepyruvate ferredoxin oxidoreductase beta subunit
MRGQFVLAGVGGQGVLFATKVLSAYARAAGQNVLGSETHDMAQRGGSVASHLKAGDYRSSLVRSASADFLFSFEPTETYRNIHFLRPGGTCFVNAPDAGFMDKQIAADLAARNIKVLTIDADRISSELDAPLAANLVLLGFAAVADPTGADVELFQETVKKLSPERFRKKNLAAFAAGIAAAR